LLAAKFPSVEDFRERLRADIRTLHQEFAAHRSGPAHLIGMV
jgi:hypothetical protein